MHAPHRHNRRIAAILAGASAVGLLSGAMLLGSVVAGNPVRDQGAPSGAPVDTPISIRVTLPAHPDRPEGEPSTGTLSG
ncbi:hypothetical protein AB0P15_03910 [Streptomyces sp. NPDC087917]|uniref:hypothetical protein n=1 Tax=Streptomyces sp. NPDC087917 TaxID=3155060 RepID=UPI003444817D